ncbi:histone-lysine N-methyltransferase PRDM9-like isoform X15 [Leguminivora glycinivorella]|uniref:histone-lysine N-methyltransferase PRDM9-like isoform X15 n=1 Tax=Leguminivora glycinivorella TaxID=1035111 RepID=UPI00200F9E35|nr:histone-lysine N-methyltransferase PRDM9-like isoform X15 [Leguminivora glycinivorella]
MEGKSTDWVRGPSGPTVCRCCFAEGCYKDISTEYFWMGKKEVYCEMLTETFDLSIAFAQTSGPNSNSRLICEPCISRLRDASEFKKQVQECEKMFMQYLDPGRSTVEEIQLEITQEPMEKGVKLEPVKLEKNQSDDDFDDRGGFEDMDEDDLDDQPLTKLASKVPKKESVDLLDLLDNAKAEKRKSSTKAKASPAKKAKTKKETPKATVSKPKPEKKKKEIKSVASGSVSNHSVEKQNAEIIIQYTTAFPFRLPVDSLVCVYCCDEFQDPTLFRKHMVDEHQQFKVTIAFAHISDGDLKVDCTELQCRICSEPFDKLDDAAEHLFNIHNYPIDFNYHLGLQPFTLYKHVLLCAVCGVKYPCLRTLSKHTQTHFVRFTCETCGKSYSVITSLVKHRRFCKKGNGPICPKCFTVFPSLEARIQHYKESNKCRRYMCNKCGERFYTRNLKQHHLLDVHNEEKKQLSCPECNSKFSSRNSFAAHFKITHTNNYFQCTYCDRRFHAENKLKRHIVGHTGEKPFVCPVCSKPFPRKHNLVQHMWIHNAEKRFACKLCDKQFTQKISWKTHMRSHHPELYDNMDFNQPVKKASISKP